MLKKLSFAIALMALSYSSFSQYDYRKFRVDVGIGCAIPKGGAGVLFAVEPKYSIIPNRLSAGLRIESALMAKDVSGTNASVAATVSYILTGDYHFTETTARPFAGAGIGLYNNAGVTVSSSSSGTTEDGSASSNLGFLLRGGVDVAHMRIALEYNLVPSSTAQSITSTGSGTVVENVTVKNSYLGIKFSVYIGGGKK